MVFRIKYIAAILIAIMIGIAASYVVLPTKNITATTGIVTPDCGQVQSSDLDIQFSVQSEPLVSQQSTGGPITAQQAIYAATAHAFISNQLPAPLVKTQYVVYSNNVRGIATASDDDASADQNLVSQNVNAWIVSFCGVVVYPHLFVKPNPTITVTPRNEWNVVVDAYTGQVIEQYSTR